MNSREVLTGKNVQENVGEVVGKTLGNAKIPKNVKKLMGNIPLNCSKSYLRVLAEMCQCSDNK